MKYSPPEKHQPVTDLHLKSNAPIWKRLFSPSMPDWTPAKVTVTGLLLVVLAISVTTIYPPQPTRDFEAPTIQAGELEFSNMNLSAYDGMQLTVRESKNSSRRRSSSRGGAIIEGTITNTGNRELLLTTGYAGNATRTYPMGAVLSILSELRVLSELSVGAE